MSWPRHDKHRKFKVLVESMKKTSLTALRRGLVLGLALASVQIQAQTLRDKFDFIADQAEAQLPIYFPAGPETFEAEALGASWFARFYEGTGVYAALNIDENNVYTLGGPWPEPFLVGDVDTLLGLLGYVPPAPGGSGDNAILNSGNGNCVALTAPAEGTVALYRFTSSSDGETVEGEYTSRYLAVSDNQITLETEQTQTLDGFAVSSVSVTTSTTRRENGLIFQTEADLEVSTTFPGFPDQVQRQVTEFDPDLLSSPDPICEGMVWYAAQVTANSTYIPEVPGLPAQSTAGDVTNTINAIFEQITVPAGSFAAVKTTIENGFDDAYTITWSSYDNGGIPVRAETYDDSGTLISTVELVNLTLP